MFFGPTVNAARGIAGTVLAAVKGFSGNFTTALNPAITKAYAAKDYNYMTKLMFSGSKLVFILLFTIMLPLFLKCHYVLELWLKIVPEYSVVFIQILLVQTLIESMWMPLFISGLATGKIKSFGLITSCLNICQVLVAYIVLRLGASPIFVIGLLALWQLMAYSVQFYTLGRLIDFKYKDYLFKVKLRSLIVLILGGLVSEMVVSFFNDSFFMLVMFCVFTTIVSLVLSYFILLDKSEKVFVVSKIQNIIK